MLLCHAVDSTAIPVVTLLFNSISMKNLCHPSITSILPAPKLSYAQSRIFATLQPFRTAGFAWSWPREVWRDANVQRGSPPPEFSLLCSSWLAGALSCLHRHTTAVSFFLPHHPNNCCNLWVKLPNATFPPLFSCICRWSACLICLLLSNLAGEYVKCAGIQWCSVSYHCIALLLAMGTMRISLVKAHPGMCQDWQRTQVIIAAVLRIF